MYIDSSTDSSRGNKNISLNKKVINFVAYGLIGRRQKRKIRKNT